MREQECFTFRESGVVGPAISEAGIAHDPDRTQKFYI